jgi:pyruvate dehydrogenase E2 component (dihydrolipoamide acetyltransferase)
MAVKVKLPKMSDTMEEGVIVAWQVKVGDEVKPGDILAEVETDKATMDLENYEKGTVLHLVAEEGSAIGVDSTIAIIGAKGENFEDLLKEADAPVTKEESKEEDASAAASSEPATSPAAVAVPSTNVVDGRLKASPLARKIAEEKGIDLNMLAGSGEGGRIVKRDVESYTPSQAVAAAVPGIESFEEVPVSQMRKTIARRLSESKFSAPHFYLTMEIRMDKAVAARAAMNQLGDTKISMNDIVVKAVAQALKQHPQVNSSWLGDKIRYNKHIHVGVAMAVDEGLLVPVVKFTDQKSLSQISAEVKNFSQKAKDKKLQPSDWEGNTFTVSNLGMFGIEEFTAIINPPDACILAVGGVKDVPVVENGQILPGKTMKVTLSCDHRVVDGVVGSRFLQTLKGLLEEPVAMLI